MGDRVDISSQVCSDLGWPLLVEYWRDRCGTERASDELEHVEFIGSADEIAIRLAAVDELQDLRELGAELSFAGVCDARSDVSRTKKGGTLGPKELVRLGRCAEACDGIRTTILAHQDKLEGLTHLVPPLLPLFTISAPIAKAFGPDGQLADSASPNLAGLRKKLQRARAALEHKAKTILEDPVISQSLQDSYFTTRADRVVVPIKANRQSEVKGIVHGTSQSGQTVFLEPQVLVNLNNELRLAECELKDEEERIYQALSAGLAMSADDMLETLNHVTELDKINAASRLADTLDATVPNVHSGDILLKQCRHPLIVLSGKHCVGNDLLLEEGRSLIISGPNAGGKTVLLSAIGLSVLMLRAGLPLPCAAGSHLPAFSRVFCDIGDSQSIERDLSTFSAHLTSIHEICERVDENSLVLVDEIAVGTEPEQGAALAQAVLEELTSKGAVLVVTTHFERLKTLGSESDNFVNGSMGFDMGSLLPTFRLRLGAPGNSGALFLAERIGLSKAIRDRAAELAGSERLQLDRLLAELTHKELALEAEHEALKHARREAEMAEARAERERERASQARQRAHVESHSEAMESLAAVRRELEGMRKSLARVSSKQQVRESEKRSAALAGKIREHKPKGPENLRTPLSSSQLVLGRAVFVEGLGALGTIAERIDDSRVVVQVGVLKTRVGIDQLFCPLSDEKGKAKHQSKKVSKSLAQQEQSSFGSAPSAGELPVAGAPRVDLRGSRVHEALDSVDRAIDRCLLKDEPLLCVIHGHGTGALKRAVRDHLRSHPLVRDMRPGEKGEGGDGVTVVFVEGQVQSGRS